MIIGLYLRHIKAYKGIKYIPIGEKYGFVSYLGENGIGKSTILEALDAFFNNKKYIINNETLKDGIGGQNNPFILPIFLIDKSKIKKNKKEFEKLSNYFWNVKKENLPPALKGSLKDFFDLRESVQGKKDTHFLILMGETNFTITHKIYFGSFHTEEKFLSTLLEKDNGELNGKTGNDRNEIINKRTEEFNKKLDTKIWKDIMQELKNLYSYIYFPVEIDIENFTKIETEEMQKIFDTNIKKIISAALNGVNFNKGSSSISGKLDGFIEGLHDVLGDYSYNTGVLRGNSVTKSDIVEKIIEVYFQKRILHKGGKKVSDLSSGEKRQALIYLVYAFLKKGENREKDIIIAIDEPENSLHTSLCYDQFEKLIDISENNQILITTHRYGFLPIVNKGIGHFLSHENNKEIVFESYDLYDYKARVKQDVKNSRNEIPHSFYLKSTNDLVQSIYYSLEGEKPYNWLIVEGISEKIYFESFYNDIIKDKKLRILCLGGKDKVIELYHFLSLPIRYTNSKGKVFCLIDTDVIESGKDIGKGDKESNLIIRRLSNNNDNKKTELILLNSRDNSICDIEQSLNPIVFQNTMNGLNVDDKYKVKNIENHDGNCSFIKNFRNINIEDFFKENDGNNKIIFAKEYVKNLENIEESDKYIPERINEIKNFFN